ncbi:phage baseplate assembly protein V, partial [Herbaspirillum sp. YR522]|uniref:phage baseplate assembly protein V n=1 Tax=Herbaspirillum sp. YR522 TaxID=1144342 RepID=UPI00026FAAE8
MFLSNQVRQAAQSLNGDEPARRGIVSGYDPNAYAVKVLLQPDSNETGWIPLEAVWVGNGWGMFAPPSLGDDVEISFREGSASAGMAGGR